MKVKARLFKGIEFITIGELPMDQQLLLQGSPEEPERIKIQIDGKIIENCLQYSKYVLWYTKVFATSVPSGDEKVISSPGTVIVKTA